MIRRAVLTAVLLALLSIHTAAAYLVVYYSVRTPEGEIPSPAPSAYLTIAVDGSTDPSHQSNPSAGTWVTTATVVGSDTVPAGAFYWQVPEGSYIRLSCFYSGVSTPVGYLLGSTSPVNLNSAIPHETTPEPSWAEQLVPYSGADEDVDLGWYDLLARSIRLHETAAPTVAAGAVVAEGAGPLTGGYWWAVTYVTPYGESAPGYGGVGWSATLSSNSARISGIPVGPSEVTARKIYRTVAGGTYPCYLVGTISDNTTTTYLDAVADAALGAAWNVAGTTGAYLDIDGDLALVLSPNLVSVGRGNGTAPQVENNVWVGNGIAPAVTTAHDTTVVGSGGAGASITTAAGDSYYGAGAGHSHQFGNRNAWYGLNAFWHNVDGAYNSGFGAWAGFESIHGYGCTYLGYMAGYAETGDSLLRVTVAKPDGTPQTLISGQGGASPSVSIGGTFSANNISGTNTGDQDLSDYAQTDEANEWAARQTFSSGAAFGGTATSDVEPEGTSITAQGAYPLATTHTTGGDLYLGGGVGTRGFTIVAYASLYGQSVRVIVDEHLPTEAYYLLTEGVHFAAQTSNAVTATNLAAAVNAWCPGAYATASGAVAAVEKAPGAALVRVESLTSCITASNASSGTAYMVSPLDLLDDVTVHEALTFAPAGWSPLPSVTTLSIDHPIVRVSSASAFAPTGFSVGISVADGTLVMLQFEDANVTLTQSVFPGLASDFTSSAGAWLMLIYDGGDARFEEVMRSPIEELDPRLPAPGTSGNVMTSNGSAWTSATPATPATPTLQTVTDAGATSTNGLTLTVNGAYMTGTATLDNSTGDEAAFVLNYTTNKATSGNDTGLEINMTDTASPGTSYIINAKVGGVSKFYLTASGSASIGDSVYVPHLQGIQGQANNYTIDINSRGFSTAGRFAAQVATGSFTASSGSNGGMKIASTVNESGSAAHTDLLINRTETTVGSGAQYLIDAQVGGTSKFRATNGGEMWSNGYNMIALDTAPSSAADTGTLGEVRITADYIYVCTATNTWKRAALSTW